MNLFPQSLTQLEDVASEIRRPSVEMIICGRWGHIGGSFSMAELLTVLYFHTLRVDPGNPSEMPATARSSLRPFQKTNHPNNRGFPRKKQPIWDSLNPGTT
jgi:hypothetical protein